MFFANKIEEYFRDELAFLLCIHLEAIKVKKKEQTIYVWTNKCDYEKVSVQREDTLENVDRCVIGNVLIERERRMRLCCL